MTFSDAISSVLSKYATFTGRARRSEYWWFYLFTVLVNIATSTVDASVSAAVGNDWNLLSVVAGLALLLPSIAVGVRRLHDTGRTGWWLLLPLVPMLAGLVSFVGFFIAMFGADFSGTVSDSYSPDLSGTVGLMLVLVFGFALLALVGGITLVVFFCLDSTPGPNKYGASPKPPAPPVAPGGFYPPGGYGQPWPYPPQGYPPQP